MSQEAVDDLVQLLDLEPIEVNIFRGVSPDEERQRVFGGQVAGQALVAAARTVEPGRRVHSLHAYFLRPGDPTVPILYEVDRIRDGRSFTTRRVVAIQHGKAIFNLQSQLPGARGRARPPGADARRARPRGRCPTSATRMAPYAEALGDWYHRPRPIDMRYVDWNPPDRTEPLPPVPAGVAAGRRHAARRPGAARLRAHLRVSDMTLLDTALLPHGGSWDDEDLMMASLDHAMWFHRPFRADEWLLYDQDTPSASGGRGLGRGQHLHRATGTSRSRSCRRA